MHRDRQLLALRFLVDRLMAGMRQRAVLFDAAREDAGDRAGSFDPTNLLHRQVWTARRYDGDGGN